MPRYLDLDSGAFLCLYVGSDSHYRLLLAIHFIPNAASAVSSAINFSFS
ncbi:hypothetical protein SAMN05444405_11754 [Bacteroides luti]|uniref:Uncharacterized protein n=1 Tax=Bacteroides luti TaxID=1297750 RepID=A0A1M5FPA0_9BACE|nr:hypothetical protein SAMN05444405_11754 [Bacteroides luti]